MKNERMRKEEVEWKKQSEKEGMEEKWEEEEKKRKSKRRKLKPRIHPPPPPIKKNQKHHLKNEPQMKTSEDRKNPKNEKAREKNLYNSGLAGILIMQNRISCTRSPFPRPASVSSRDEGETKRKRNT